MMLLPIALLGGGLVLVGRRMAVAAGRLEYGLGGIPKFRTRGGLQIEVPLRITNPTNQALYFDEIAADVRHGETFLGQVVYQKRTMIAANAATDVPLVLRISAQGIVQGVVSVLKSMQPGEVSLTGKVKAGPVAYPLDFKFKLKKPAK